MKKFSGVIVVFLLGLAVGTAGTISLTGRSLEISGQKPTPAASDNALGGPVTSSTVGKFADPAYRWRLSGTVKSSPYANHPIEVRAKGLIESVAGRAPERTILFQVKTVEGFQTLGGPKRGAPPGAPPLVAGGKLQARVSPLIKTTLDPGPYDAIFRFAPGSSGPPVAVKLDHRDK